MKLQEPARWAAELRGATFVALVDDEAAVRKALVRLLRAAGLKAQGFGSAAAFLESLAMRRPDCLVVDLHMPGMSGLEMLREMQRRGMSLPTVIMTVSYGPQARELCRDAGASVFLCKPIDGSMLMEAIAAAVATSGSCGTA
jgi:FixJ family two-component response regulator